MINNVISNILKIENFDICNYTPEYYTNKNKNIVKFYINKYENTLLFYNFNNFKYTIIINNNKYKLYENKYVYNEKYIFVKKYINISSIYLRIIEIWNIKINRTNYDLYNILYNKLDNKIIKLYNKNLNTTESSCYEYYNYDTIYTNLKRKIFDKYINPNIYKKLLLLFRNNKKIKLNKLYKYKYIYIYIIIKHT